MSTSLDARNDVAAAHFKALMGSVLTPPTPPTPLAAPAGKADQPAPVVVSKVKQQRKAKAAAKPALSLLAQGLLIADLARRAAFEDETAWETEAASGRSPYMVENLYAVQLTGQDWLEVACPPPAAPEYDADGNVIIDVDLTPAQADLLNAVLAGMDFKASKRKLTVVEATLKLTPNQRGHLGVLVKQELVVKQKDGWVLTDKALELYGVTRKDLHLAALSQHSAQPIQ